MVPYGVISGPDDLLDSIIAHRSLKPSRRDPLRPLHYDVLDAGPLPSGGDTYEDEHTIFYRFPDSRSIYFEHRSRLARQ